MLASAWSPEPSPPPLRPLTYLLLATAQCCLLPITRVFPPATLCHRPAISQERRRRPRPAVASSLSSSNARFTVIRPCHIYNYSAATAETGRLTNVSLLLDVMDS
jgi:hypothetical protein